MEEGSCKRSKGGGVCEISRSPGQIFNLAIIGGLTKYSLEDEWFQKDGMNGFQGETRSVEFITYHLDFSDRGLSFRDDETARKLGQPNTESYRSTIFFASIAK